MTEARYYLEQSLFPVDEGSDICVKARLIPMRRWVWPGNRERLSVSWTEKGEDKANEYGFGVMCVLYSENLAFVAYSARDAFVIEKFKQRDCILARQPARDLFEDRDVNLRVD